MQIVLLHFHLMELFLIVLLTDIYLQILVYLVFHKLHSIDRLLSFHLVLQLYLDQSF
uniref:Uncharacterized protein n=1 Tax=uncultured marine virus TaxID=186617 RepID=A0A0F7L4A2_9VIRU|nr:hypothetical protein [uncultured marine virus]